MKIVIKGIEIHLLPADHMLIIFEPNGIIFKCTVCAGTKDIHYLCTINGEQPLPFAWMKTCTCGNAPRSGGDIQPLIEKPVQVPGQHPYHPLSGASNIVCANATTYRARLVGRDEG